MHNKSLNTSILFKVSDIQVYLSLFIRYEDKFYLILINYNKVVMIFDFNFILHSQMMINIDRVASNNWWLMNGIYSKFDICRDHMMLYAIECISYNYNYVQLNDISNFLIDANWYFKLFIIYYLVVAKVRTIRRKIYRNAIVKEYNLSWYDG